MLEIVRDYWGIENGLHYRCDKTLREDATHMTSPTLAEVMAILNNLVIGLTAQQWGGIYPKPAVITTHASRTR